MLCFRSRTWLFIEGRGGTLQFHMYDMRTTPKTPLSPHSVLLSPRRFFEPL